MNSTNFKITGLPLESFLSWFQMTDEGLVARNARRCTADAKPSFPCRVSLKEAEIGESVILMAYIHHPTSGPYQSSGPIYVRENAEPAQLQINEIPEVARHRLMSIRGYGVDSVMIASDVVEGENLESAIRVFFSDPKVHYLHLHNAKPGCYSCRVDRA